MRALAGVVALLLCGCSGEGRAILMAAPDAGAGGASDDAGADVAGPDASPDAAGPFTSPAGALAARLGKPSRFLIGIGNDNPPDYDWNRADVHTFGAKLDLHYVFLTGVAGENGWPDWNPGGWYPVVIGQVDLKKDVLPIFTVYALGGGGPEGLSKLTDAVYMERYWASAALLASRLGGDVDGPAIVHLEPNFLGYAQVSSSGASTPALLPEACRELPDTIGGLGSCWVKLLRTGAPKVAIAFHASSWASDSAENIAEFLNQTGAAQADLIVVDVAQRDAGCYEAKAPPCDAGDGVFYWDMTNQSSPNFHEHLAWTKTISDRLKKPILWWQLPFGVPSDTPGGTPGHYRDNRVRYLFDHPEEFVAAGGFGAVFGVADATQTYITSDGGQFLAAATSYNAAPVPLP